MPKSSADGKLSPFAVSVAKISAFVVVFATAVPTYQQWFKSLQLKVPFSKVSEAESQDQLWQQNKDCYKKATPVQVKTNTNDALSVTICPTTGDLLLDVQPGGSNQQITRWIGLHDFEAGSTLASILTTTAFAADEPLEIAQVPTVVLCQKFLGPGLILRRVRYANGQCVDQQINTYSGLVVKAAPASCTANC